MNWFFFGGGFSEIWSNPTIWVHNTHLSHPCNTTTYWAVLSSCEYFFLHLTFALILMNSSELDAHSPLMDPLSFRGIHTCFLKEKSSGPKFETELYRMSYTIINYHHHHRNVCHNHTQSWQLRQWGEKKNKKLVHVENSKYHVTMLKGLQQCCATMLAFYNPVVKTIVGSIPRAWHTGRVRDLEGASKEHQMTQRELHGVLQTTTTKKNNTTTMMYLLQQVKHIPSVL
jgi:hypothetical protein